MKEATKSSATAMNPHAKKAVLVTIAIAAWGAGFFMGSERADESSVARSAGKAGAVWEEKLAASHATKASASAGEVSAEDRRGRVLQRLFEAMQQPEAVRNVRGDFLDVENIGPDDIRAAIEFVLKRGDDSGVEYVMSQLVARWIEFDPKTAADFALTFIKGPPLRAPWFRDNLIDVVATKWAGKDPAAVKAWALALPTGKEQQAALAGVAGNMMRNDPAAGLAWVKSLPRVMRAESLYRQIFTDWCSRDPLAASQQALALPLGADRQAALAAVAQQWAETDPQAALEMLQEVPESGTRNMEIANTLRKWASTNPDAAMDAASEIPAGGYRAYAYGCILAEAARKSKDEASRLLEKIPEGSERAEAQIIAAKSAKD